MKKASKNSRKRTIAMGLLVSDCRALSMVVCMRASTDVARWNIEADDEEGGRLAGPRPFAGGGFLPLASGGDLD